MNTLVNLVHAGHVQAVGGARTEGIFEWAQTQAEQARATIIVIGVVVGVGAFLVIAFKGKFSLASIIMGAVAGGLIGWGVTGGVQWATDRVTDTTESGAASAVLVVPHTDPVAAGDGQVLTLQRSALL